MTHALGFGAQVRMTDYLENGWADGRSAIGGDPAPGVGLVVGLLDRGYCGTCDVLEMPCDGPFYDVAFPVTGDGSYAEHELAVAP